MPSKPHTDEVYNQKRVPKNPIKYQFTLTEEQKEAKASVYEKDVTFILGTYGTGKTACACQIALDLVFKRHNGIDKIYISRPIDFSATGYLKGSIQEKMDLFIMPIKQNLYAAYSKEKIDKMFADEVIHIVPINYLKGFTFTDAVIIIDEFEDINYHDFKLVLTRLGKNSKLMFTGSEEQTDIKDSCIPQIKKLKNSGIVGYHELTINHRNEDIVKIIDYIDSH